MIIPRISRMAAYLVVCLFAMMTSAQNQPKTFTFTQTSDGFMISLSGVKVLEHSSQSPMLYIGLGETNITTFHGNFYFNEYLIERRGLAAYEVMSLTDISVQIGFKEVESPALLAVVTISRPTTRSFLTIEATATARTTDRMWLRIAAEKDEHVYGGGEQFSHFDLRGRSFPIWTREQGVGRNKSTLLTFLVDQYMKDAGGNYHTTYFPQSTFFSSRKFWCHVNGSNYVVMDFSHETFHEIEIRDTSSAKVLINTSPSMLELVQSFTDFNGRPPPLPDWIHNGAILGVQGGTQKMLDYYKQATASGLKVSGLWIQDWVGRLTTSFGDRLFWNWKWNQTLYPNLDQEIIALRRDHDVHVLGYINPNMNIEGDMYKEAAGKGYVVKNAQNGPLQVNFGDFFCGIVDLTNPEAFEWYKSVIKTNMIGIGLDGWMADFGEYLPTDGVVLHNGMSGREVHNLWPVLWAKLNREAVEEAGKMGQVVYFMRAGAAGTAKYSTLMWAGDQNVDFSYADGLASTIPAALSMGVSGMGLTHFDVGGYTAIPLPPLNLVRTKELLLRSAEAAVFTPVFRTHEGNQPKLCAQFYSDQDTLNKFARLTKMFSVLQQYTKQLVNEVVTSGTPAQRPLFLHYPDDARAYEIQYQYMYGRDFIVAPVFLENQSQWNLYLPAGKWIFFWNGTTVTGPADVTVDAPIGQTPVFFRSDSTWTNLFKTVAAIKEGDECSRVSTGDGDLQTCRP
ncbi:uncharacterized protein LOC106172883 [Lingula anatina]|uniref:Uncharacterized protein LOC106172883 n=1 Tax=Lingula anatina TaxID=7574 RepID=A0A1S3JFT5_LINAN|nr:uncharacterized protein LOC106172883 [Lingula anatina]XP_013409262.1 uncharacterized protein LOC106172883 [Lingula anatina]XP_013409263.1 uncharacterized protein LOC106172883 [Lingula anatina]|eukprot:XP_013409261.1 uncharacterized protein LOC106172883 [Lingula anatina]